MGPHHDARRARRIDRAASLLQFPTRGIACNNGSELINHHLLAYCAQRQITCIRSEARKQNDGCDLEWKNWDRVRELVTYCR